MKKVVFSDEATFHLASSVNEYDLRIWESKNHHPLIKHVKDCLKLNMFCAMSETRCWGCSSLLNQLWLVLFT